MDKIKAFFKGIWQFVIYLFVPHMGSRRNSRYMKTDLMKQ